MFLKFVICRLILAKASHIYKHYDCISLYLLSEYLVYQGTWLSRYLVYQGTWCIKVLGISRYLVYQVPEFGAIEPKLVDILIKYAFVYVVCFCWFNKKK
jgi:hypothetical protein